MSFRGEFLTFPCYLTLSLSRRRTEMPPPGIRRAILFCGLFLQQTVIWQLRHAPYLQLLHRQEVTRGKHGESLSFVFLVQLYVQRFPLFRTCHHFNVTQERKKISTRRVAHRVFVMQGIPSLCKPRFNFPKFPTSAASAVPVPS